MALQNSFMLTSSGYISEKYGGKNYFNMSTYGNGDDYKKLYSPTHERLYSQNNYATVYISNIEDTGYIYKGSFSRGMVSSSNGAVRYQHDSGWWTVDKRNGDVYYINIGYNLYYDYTGAQSYIKIFRKDKDGINKNFNGLDTNVITFNYQDFYSNQILNINDVEILIDYSKDKLYLMFEDSSSVNLNIPERSGKTHFSIDLVDGTTDTDSTIHDWERFAMGSSVSQNYYTLLNTVVNTIPNYGVNHHTYSPITGKIISFYDMNFNSIPYIVIRDLEEKTEERVSFRDLDLLGQHKGLQYSYLTAEEDPNNIYNNEESTAHRQIQVMEKSGNVLILMGKDFYKLSPGCKTVLAHKNIFDLTNSTTEVFRLMNYNEVTEEYLLNTGSSSFMFNNVDELIIEDPSMSGSPTCYIPGLLEDAANETVASRIVFPLDNQLLSDTTPDMVFTVNHNAVGWTQQFRIVFDRDADKLRSGSAVTAYEHVVDSWASGDNYIDAAWEYSTDYTTGQLPTESGTWSAIGSGDGLQAGGTHIVNGIDENETGTFHVKMTVPVTEALEGADTGDTWYYKVYSYSKFVS